ncbi:hypothetical protein [Actinoplanes friuliensis]|uniref:Uncharacterized protein n=1 Tax=Actinoplanes friuliensis DSM 7358 TaxID=1246995 RepID=U5VS30_9ACTN|nr:hypothetical protein [Actinoplanes friuliensis]AGZ39597.1 hypothetical protein AFR_06540 [Actinoplanes friuliensis DSM 7358]
MTATTTAVEGIPANEHSTGFTAVALRFPADPAAHRIERVLHHPDTADTPAEQRSGPFAAGGWEIRPACLPDSNPGERFYELSTPAALARGALPCGHRDCFGGAA